MMEQEEMITQEAMAETPPGNVVAPRHLMDVVSAIHGLH